MARKVLVGMLLLGALIIFALATFYIENWQYYLQVRKGYQLTARFESAQDLRKGDEVRLAGVEIGRVHELKIDIDADPTHPVHALLWAEEDVKVRAEDVASVEVRSVFGGSYIVITPGDPQAAVLKHGDEIKNTKVSASLTDLVGKADTMLSRMGDAIGDASAALESIKNMTTKIEQGEGTLGKLLTDEQAYTDLRETLASTREAFDGLGQLITDMHEGKGLLAKLMTDEKLAENVEKLVLNANESMVSLQKITSGIESGEGVAGLLLKDKEFAEKVRQIVSDLEGVTKTMAKVSEDFEASTLGKLVTSDEVYNSLTETLDQMKKSVAQFSEGEGTLGKLVKDDKVYNQISAALESVQKLLDDYREQSPVLTFFGAVFGAF